MATINISIPNDSPQLSITFVFLHKVTSDNIPSTSLMYLQNKRSGALASAARKSGLLSPEEHPIARGYHAGLRSHVSDMTQEVIALNCHVAAVVSPPSNSPGDASPYRAALIENFKGAVDLTERFQRAEGISSGGGATWNDLYNGVLYTPKGDEPSFTSILIVDDVLSRGRTAALIALKLRDAGVPLACKFIAVSPLWIPRA